MAYSYVDYSGNGVLTQFTVPFPYLDKSHITVSVGGSPVAFTWFSDTVVATTVAPVAGISNVRIRRVTPTSASVITFVDGGTLTQDQLNSIALQQVYTLQEQIDFPPDFVFINRDSAYASVSRQLPIPTANKVLSWDSGATAIMNVDPGSTTLAVPAGQSVDQTKLAVDVQYQVDTFAALRALTTKYNTVLVRGATAVGDGGEGIFRWFSTDVTADNSGTVLMPNAGGTGRWWRLCDQTDLHADWFSGSIANAVAALPTGGGRVRLASKTYISPYINDASRLQKDNVSIVGAVRPQFNTGFTGLTGGSIIQGQFLVFANNFSIATCGIDSGSAVCTAQYAGVAQNGLVAYKYAQAIGGNKTGLNVTNFIAICQSASALVHAILLEGYDDVHFHNLDAVYGTHGIVIKSNLVRGSNIRARGNNSEGVLIKNNDYALATDVVVSNVLVESITGSLEAGVGFFIDAQATATPIARVCLSNIAVVKKTTALQFSATTSPVTDLTVTGLISEGCTTGISYGGLIHRASVSNVVINNATQAVNVASTTTTKSNVISSITSTNNTSGIVCAGNLSVDNAIFDGSGVAYTFSTSGVRMQIGATKLYNSSTLWNLSYSLLNSWVNFGLGNDPFTIEVIGGNVVIHGLIKSGTGVAIATLPANIAPSGTMRFLVDGYNGASFVTCEIVVDSAGNLSCPNYPSGASSYLSLSGVSYPMPS